MTTEELEKLRSKLPKNNLEALSKITGFSTVYIWQVLNGERKNDVIIDAAIQLAKEELEKINARKMAIENL